MCDVFVSSSFRTSARASAATGGCTASRFPLGRWPASLFRSLSRHATEAAWYGAVGSDGQRARPRRGVHAGGLRRRHQPHGQNGLPGGPEPRQRGGRGQRRAVLQGGHGHRRGQHLLLRLRIWVGLTLANPGTQCPYACILHT
jgi:hypothetical protein